MTVLDLFTVVVAIGVLVGIALGVHIAFCLADPDRKDADGSEDNPYFVEQKITPSTADKSYKEKKEKKPHISFKGHKDKKSSLKEKVKQPEMSFSQFACQFTGEDPEEKLNAAMHQQDESYHFLGEDGSE